MKVYHTFEPVYDENSKVLILGTMPSVKSRETGFYYGHKRNRFWKVLACILNQDVPDTIDDKIHFLIRNNIALWDVLSQCDIHASSDVSIKNEIPNDINAVLKNTGIQHVYANGATAYRLYNKYCLKETGVEIILLPSTSPANASYGLEELVKEWKTKINLHL